MKNRKTAAQCWARFQPEASACWPSPTVKVARADLAALPRRERTGTITVCGVPALTQSSVAAQSARGGGAEEVSTRGEVLTEAMTRRWGGGMRTARRRGSGNR
jgi:hypothetical protein